MIPETAELLKAAYPNGLTSKQVLKRSFNAAVADMSMLEERMRKTGCTAEFSDKVWSLIHRQIFEAHVTGALNVVACVSTDIPIADDIASISVTDVEEVIRVETDRLTAPLE